jgi:hypothetical protein
MLIVSIPATSCVAVQSVHAQPCTPNRMSSLLLPHEEAFLNTLFKLLDILQQVKEELLSES